MRGEMRTTVKRRLRTIDTAIELLRCEWEDGDNCGTPGNHWYQLECLGHGEFSEEYNKLSEARMAMIESRTWCIGCREGWPVDEEAIEATNS
jgi:hypothetical protein